MMTHDDATSLKRWWSTPVPPRFAILLVLAGLCGAPTSLDAQRAFGSIRGLIVADAGTPVKNARATIPALGRSVSSDTAGRFLFTAVPPSEYEVAVFHPGYRAATGKIRVRVGDTVSMTFRLVGAPAQLPVFKVTAERAPAAISYLEAARGTFLIGGKKNEVVNLAATPGNIAENNPRQIFARVPGITVWELDGNGLQLNIASRGLSPHRSWEFLVAQNGYHVNSDLYGYPEAHYNPPMEAVERIEIVRGTGALAYGPQFGGMVDYILKRGDSTRALAFESSQSAGSNSMLGTYDAVGGQVGRLNYYSYFDYRRRNGWRSKSAYDFYAAHTGVEFAASPTLRLGAEFSWMYYVVQFAGGLNDAQFQADARQATRSRNFFSPNMKIPALWMAWDISRDTRLDVRASGIIGQRNSVQFIANPTVADTLNPALGSYNPRVVDRDYYRGLTLETRLRSAYQALGQTQVVSGGIKLFDERTTRRQRGVGTVGSDFDLALTAPGYPTDLDYFTRSVALFIEHGFTPLPQLLITSGARYELIDSHFDGALNGTHYADAATQRRRRVLLLGAGAQFRLGPAVTLYAGWSQAFRPVLYSDLIPSGSVAIVDSTLRDARGENAEVGFRGSLGRAFKFDVAAFHLRYPNRVGTVGVGAGTAGAYVLRTNVGTSVARGIEAYLEFHPLWLDEAAHTTDVSLFTATAYNRARYTDGSVVTGSGSGTVNTSSVGNRVDGAPDWIVRSGATLTRSGVSLTVQHNRVSSSFADALNATTSVNGATGLVPGYTVLDFSVGYERAPFSVRAGVNNFTNTIYFTRRTTQYPGPGIIPSDGRTVFFTLSERLP